MIEARRRDGRARTCEAGAFETPALAVIDDGSPSAARVLEVLGERAVRLRPEGRAHFDLRARSAGEPTLVPVGEGHLAAAGLPPAGRDPVGFIAALLSLRDAAGPGALLHLPHAATPHTVPLLAYAGADTFGPWEVFRECLRGGRFTPYALVEGPGSLEEGLSLLADSLDGARAAIAGGYLREIVEATAALTTFGAASLRAMDLDHRPFFEAYAPVHRPRGMMAGDRSLTRPEVVRFQERVIERVELPAYGVLLLLPCSARKPYSRSPSHRRFIEAIERAGAGRAVQELIATSPLGLVPRELERLYPASSYDIPVTGHWTADEREMLTSLLHRFLERHRYDAVVMHLPDHMAFLREAAPDALWTAKGPPGSAGSLDSLTSALASIAPERPAGQREAAFRAAVSLFFPRTEWLGRFRVSAYSASDGDVLVRLTDRPHLTMTGGERLMAAGIHRVSIDDFMPSGSVLAPGVVGCTGEVRPGDEVVVAFGEELRAVGTAAMCADEMVRSRRGVAVRVKGHG
ncbi:MAG: DUF5591 domain-containing protein [Thermoplasmata archaeon]|nr:DUF5591 domain-containing protein [Thermoplasmata archaeon]